jgi:hypothetical protein
MKNRTLKNWKSSLMGVILLSIATVALCTGHATLTEFLAFLPFPLGMIYVRDSIFNINSKQNG